MLLFDQVCNIPVQYLTDWIQIQDSAFQLQYFIPILYFIFLNFTHDVGGLLDGEPIGPNKIELNQGDTISGEVSRSDVAKCVAAVAISKSIPKNIIFEIYEAGKSGPLESKFSAKSGYEVRGSSYEEMFGQLKSGEIKI